MAQHKITLLPGDGIGPEVTASVVAIIECAGASTWSGKSTCRGRGGGAVRRSAAQEVLESILRNKVALKGAGHDADQHGFTSINVRLRKTLEPLRQPEAGEVDAEHRHRFENVDLVGVRENTED